MRIQLVSFSKMSVFYQKGDFLIESLIGTFLMAIVCAGVMTATSKVMLSQRDLSTQEVVIDQMRALMQAKTHEDLCVNATSDSKKLKMITTSGGVDNSRSVEITCGDTPSFNYALQPDMSKSFAAPKRVKIELKNGNNVDYSLGGAQPPAS